MGISNAIAKIKSAIYGEEVRGSIVEALETCYSDMSTKLPDACDEAISRHPEWATTVSDVYPQLLEIEIPADGWALGDYDCGEKYAHSSVPVAFNPLTKPRIVVVGVKGGDDRTADNAAFNEMGNIRIKAYTSSTVSVFASWQPSKAITLLALVSGQEGDDEVCTGGSPEIFITNNTTDNASISASTATNVKIPFPKIDGYYRVCISFRIAQATTGTANHSACCPYGVTLGDDTNVYVYIKNTASAAAKIKVSATVMYIRSARAIPYANL